MVKVRSKNKAYFAEVKKISEKEVMITVGSEIGFHSAGVVISMKNWKKLKGVD